MLTSMGPFLRRTRRCFANSEHLFANCNDDIISVASVATVLPSNQIPSGPPQSRGRIREQLRPVPMQGQHVHKEVRGFHVVIDGEEHGAEVAVDYAVGPAQVEVWSEIVATCVY